MRFLFIAASISYMLNDWSGMDIEKSVDFIKDSIVSFSLDILFNYELEYVISLTITALDKDLN